MTASAQDFKVQIIPNNAKSFVKRPLTWPVRIAFAFGYLPVYLSVLVLSVYFSFFLTGTVGLGVGKVGNIVLIAQFFDVLLDPIVGSLVDRTSTSIGRRRPWLFLAAIPFGISYFMLWLDFSGMNNVQDFAYYVILLMILKVFTSALSIPHVSLTPDLSDDYDERTLLTSLKMMVSILLSIILTYFQSSMLQHYVRSPAPIPTEKGYMISAAVIGGVMTISALITATFVKENFDPNREEDTTIPKRYQGAMGMVRNLIDCFRNGPYLLVIFTTLISYTILQINSSNLHYYVQYVLQVKNPTKNFTYLLLISQSSTFVSMPVWKLISTKLGKKNCFYIGRLFSLSASFILYFLGSHKTDVINFGFSDQFDNSNFTWFIVGLIFGGFGNGVILLIPWAMLPDTLDYDELKNGYRRESFMYGIFMMMLKASFAFAIFGSSKYLEEEGFKAGAPTQNDDVVNALRITFCLVPIGCTIVSMILVFFYPITSARLKQIQADLDEQRLSNEKQSLLS